MQSKKARRGLGVDARSVGIKAPAAEGDERAFRDFMSDIFAAAATMQTLRRSTAKPFGILSTELAVMMAVAKLNSSPASGASPITSMYRPPMSRLTWASW
jgi:hypothetical protein